MTTVLAIDAGNSRIKWGLWRDRGFLAQGAISTARADELTDAWRALERPDRAIGSSVAAEAVRAAVAKAMAPWGLTPEWIVSQRSQCGVVSRYADPAQLGSDRWAALIAARARGEEACLIVNVGTAATIDALSAQGEFLGGLILPGPELMGAALARGTARLPRQVGRFEPFPVSTADAIFSGALQALCGAVDRMEQQMLAAGCGSPRLLLSGGGAAVLVPHLARPPEYVPALVLEGLIAIARA